MASLLLSQLFFFISFVIRFINILIIHTSTTKSLIEAFLNALVLIYSVQASNKRSLRAPCIGDKHRLLGLRLMTRLMLQNFRFLSVAV
ncbi:hypothetical protein BofuT4_uP149730.1 [Botrytis cinerea T4]|uniref:Uncharacterized protein n=1 Tax=Botryotinia fuckeliana (strain T4) TaxID=999810 RepID=G2YXC5_BOTF4|nr:hypothetical protein BofuT4_uP149730.1 [Botrytis cinerea T4]